MKEYKTIKTEGNAELTQKKSRFIAKAVHVENEEDAFAFIETIKKKYYDARHNCWAYVIGDESNTLRASDDGEPQGTAGRPILDLILSAKLTYTCVVVTRYFGGTLLGTGGLVRAYSGSADLALKDAHFVYMCEADILNVKTSYSDIGKVQYIFMQNNAEIISTEYGEDVLFKIRTKSSETKHITALITESTAGRADIELITTAFTEFNDKD